MYVGCMKSMHLNSSYEHQVKTKSQSCVKEEKERNTDAEHVAQREQVALIPPRHRHSVKGSRRPGKGIMVVRRRPHLHVHGQE